MALGVQCLLLWSRLKYLNNYWVDQNEILYTFNPVVSGVLLTLLLHHHDIDCLDRNSICPIRSLNAKLI